MAQDQLQKRKIEIMTKSLCFWLCLLVLFRWSQAYRVGDVVDTFIKTEGGGGEDLMRHQMPVFGATTKSRFAERPLRFSLSFEEGLRPLPWVDTQNSMGQTLSNLEITFVYSKSGDGVIHSISSQPHYWNNPKIQGFTVKYNWVEEEEVDPQSAMALMFMATFIATVVLLVNACGIMGEESADQPQQQQPQTRQNVNAEMAYWHYQPSASTATRVPKWD